MRTPQPACSCLIAVACLRFARDLFVSFSCCMGRPLHTKADKSNGCNARSGALESNARAHAHARIWQP